MKKASEALNLEKRTDATTSKLVRNNLFKAVLSVICFEHLLYFFLKRFRIMGVALADQFQKKLH